MARNDTRRFRTQPTDRAHLRAGATSWRALANLTVASTLVVAVVVSVLTLLEAAFSTSATKLARHAPSRSVPQSSARACGNARALLTNSNAGRNLRCSLLTKRDPRSGITLKRDYAV